MDITFDVVDTACEQADQSVFPPKILMTTKSTTKIATVLGYTEYQQFVSTPPKKFKTLTWSGFALWTYTVGPVNQHTALPVGSLWQTFRWDYNGSGNIDEQGNKTSSYTKIKSHSYAPNDLQAVGNFAGDSILDSLFPGLETLAFIGGVFTVQSNVSGQAVGTGTIWSEDPNDPNETFEGLPGSFTTPQPQFYDARLDAQFNYSSMLSNEYTDAEALTNAQVILGNGATAQTLPRTTGFVSTFTSVIFSLSISPLILGKNYTASVDFWDPGTGITITKRYPITATATTANITDIIPTPLPFHATQVRNPKIVFSS